MSWEEKLTDRIRKRFKHRLLLARKVQRTVATHIRALIWLAVIVTTFFLLVATWRNQGGLSDYGLLVLEALLLIITAATLHLTIPDRARLWLDRQVELGYDDLLFYIEGDSGQGIPIEVLLQLHIAVSNVGGRKAVLSRVELVAFLDKDGKEVNLEFGPVRAMEYATRHRWIDTLAVLQGQQHSLERFNIRDELPEPFTLAPDDVITLRLRARHGIDWSDKWTIDKLHLLASQLERPIVQAQLAATFRRGNELVTENFRVSLVPVQQALYLQALRFQTNNLTHRPDISQRVYPDL